MVITGLPTAVAANTEVQLSCTVKRFRPEAYEMYFIINGKKIAGQLDTIETDGKFFKHIMNLTYT